MKALQVGIVMGLVLGGVRAVAIEEPEYSVILAAGDYEVRRYEPYVIAEVDVTGSFRSAGNQAFRILAGYIFGKNRGAEEMAMTAPVQSTPPGAGVKMAMTAPVTSTPPGAERHTYAFVMERKYSIDTLPRPIDERVRLREVPSRVVAARRFSGRWTEGNYEKHEAALLTALARDELVPHGAPILARYNGPMTPWFLRRNEVLVEVDWRQ